MRLASISLVTAGCGESSTSECETRAPDAFYCTQTEEGVDPKVPNALLVSGDTLVASFPHSLARVSAPSAMTTLIDRASSELFPVAIEHERICYTAAGALECVPLDGGAPKVLLAGSSDRQPTGLVRVRSGEYLATVTSGFGASARTSILRLDGNGAVLDTLAEFAGQGSDPTLFDGELYIAIVRADQVEIVRASLETGGARQSIGSVPRCSLELADGVLYCVGDTIRTVERERIGEPKPFPPGVHAQPALGFVRVGADRVEAISPFGEVARTLWQRPAGLDSETAIAVASNGDELFVALAHWPCASVGRDKQSQRGCDDSHGKLEIVQVRMNP